MSRGSPLSAEARALLRLLEDGGWHSYEAVAEQLSAVIAPGKALRRYEERRQRRARDYKSGRKMIELPEEEKIASGRRLVGNSTFNSMKNKMIDVEWRNGVRMVRRRPENDSESVGELSGEPGAMPAGQSPDGGPDTGDDVFPVWVWNNPDQGPEPLMCGICGGGVADLVRHEAFHRSESTAETIRFALREEIESALDMFQIGMQEFILTALAERDRQGHPFVERQSE